MGSEKYKGFGTAVAKVMELGGGSETRLEKGSTEPWRPSVLH